LKKTYDFVVVVIIIPPHHSSKEYNFTPNDKLTFRALEKRIASLNKSS
jgi:hypothetical protein